MLWSARKCCWRGTYKIRYVWHPSQRMHSTGRCIHYLSTANMQRPRLFFSRTPRCTREIQARRNIPSANDNSEDGPFLLANDSTMRYRITFQGSELLQHPFKCLHCYHLDPFFSPQQKILFGRTHVPSARWMNAIVKFGCSIGLTVR